MGKETSPFNGTCSLSHGRLVWKWLEISLSKEVIGEKKRKKKDKFKARLCWWNISMIIILTKPRELLSFPQPLRKFWNEHMFSPPLPHQIQGVNKNSRLILGESGCTLIACTHMQSRVHLCKFYPLGTLTILWILLHLNVSFMFSLIIMH